MMEKNFSRLLFRNNLLAFLLFVGTLSWSLVMVKSGLVYDFGMGFWGPNGHDGIWHIALAESIARGSLNMPVFSGSQLQNYHVGYDLILALINRITTIPISVLYFQILPPITAFLVGLLTFNFVTNMKRSYLESCFAVFFVYFGGSFGWLVTFFRGHGIGGESLFWSQQAISTLINPPFSLSLVILLFGLISLQKKRYILSAILFGILIQIKAYAGVLILSGLFIAAIWEFINSKQLHLIKVFVISLVISVILFLPLNTNSSSLLVFQPFWFLETMMGLSDRLGWQKFGEAMVNYRSGGIYIKSVAAYFIAFLIFWFGNMGTRLISEFFIAKKIIRFRKIDNIYLIILSIVAVGTIIPMFFLQKGTPWNTIQFFYYSLFFSAILAGIAFGEIYAFYKKRNLKILLVSLLLLFTLPTTLGTFKHYLPARPPAKLSNAELEALAFLSKEPDGNVITFPYDLNIYKDTDVVPKPLYLYESTAYVAAFAKKDIFLEDQVNLNIMNYDWQTRREEVLGFYDTLDENKAFNFLRENNIKYIYWVKPQRAKLGETQLGLERIFENSEVDIYKVI